MKTWDKITNYDKIKTKLRNDNVNKIYVYKKVYITVFDERIKESLIRYSRIIRRSNWYLS